ncbi:hypothetical protein [Candidatus Finniella inopinata]|uniref:Uncharacterized protein n=1 Tax=Candidatus Finniella inopinata TaxID=1696036 RepID=A0A4Q7DHU1_9PROT|nr:hypothetical protein [Candidatus Finniella inopinata]RZI46511.1 hypothetical protein EQU50_02695 [Candidatus Finniella inopinata]
MLSLELGKKTDVNEASLGELFTHKAYAATRIEATSLGYHDFIQTILRAYKEEQVHQNKFVFYHGCEAFVGFYFDLVQELRDQLFHEAGEDIRLLRAFDDLFSAENVLAMLQEEGKIQGIDDFARIDNYRGKFQDKALSANISLVGSPGHATSSTYFLFYKGQSVNAAQVEWMVKNFTVKFGCPESFPAYRKIYDQYINKKEPYDNGRLLQIFIDGSVIDDVCYLSLTHGKMPFESDASNLGAKLAEFKPSVLLTLLRENSTKFLSQLQAIGGLKNITIESLQSRLYLKPEIFWDPSKVMIKTYWRHTLNHDEQMAYKRDLKAQIQRDLSHWLKSRKHVDKGTFFQKKLPLQEIYKKVYEKNHGENSYPAAVSFSVTDLMSAFKTDDVEKLKAIIKDHNLDIDKELVTPDSWPATSIEMAERFNAFKCVNLLLEYIYLSLIRDEYIRIQGQEDVFKESNIYSKKRKAIDWRDIGKAVDTINDDRVRQTAIEDVKTAANLDEKKVVAKAWISIGTIKDDHIRQTARRKVLAADKDDKEDIATNWENIAKALETINDDRVRQTAIEEVLKENDWYLQLDKAKEWVSIWEIIKPITDTHLQAQALEAIKKTKTHTRQTVARTWVNIARIDDAVIRQAVIQDVFNKTGGSVQEAASKEWVSIWEIIKPIADKNLRAQALENIKTAPTDEYDDLYKQYIAQAWVTLSTIKDENIRKMAIEDVGNYPADKKNEVAKLWVTLTRISNKDIREAAIKDCKNETDAFEKQDTAKAWVTIDSIKDERTREQAIEAVKAAGDGFAKVMAAERYVKK